LALSVGGPDEDCRNVKNRVLYQRCLDKAVGGQRHANYHWNAWGSYWSWVPILLLLVVAIVVGFKAVFSKSRKVLLNRQARLALFFGDALFLVAIIHIPHDNAGRAWALWLSLVCVIILNIGVLLAMTDAGVWVAEHWPRRTKAATQSTGIPPTTPTSPPPGWRPPAQAYPANQGFEVDYRPTPQATPPGQRPPDPAWPQAGSVGDRGFPNSGGQPPPQ
jgi:hypothetical protein